MDSAQNAGASDMAADSTSAYSSGNTGAPDTAADLSGQEHADSTPDTSDSAQNTFDSAPDTDQGEQPSRSRYEYHNYYNDRYRGDDSKRKYGYQPGVQQTPAPK